MPLDSLAARAAGLLGTTSATKPGSSLGVFIPEGGAFFRANLGVRPYLAWSAPFLWHRRELFYRTSPYLLREHFAVYFEPGVLWVPGEPVVATLSLGAGLW